MALLEVKNLKKSFGSTQVLKGVSFTLDEGEVLSVIGSSGGGKTTLLRCLNFLEIADEGEISIAGETVFKALGDGNKPYIDPNVQEKMGLVFQQFNLFPQYSVKQNLTLAPMIVEKKKAGKGYKSRKNEIISSIEAKALELLQMVNLTEKADTYPCFLSGGQQQRVSIARALMLEPEVLCFDEPTSSLDPELTGEVLSVIRNLKSPERAMIVVTHELEFARKVADHVIFFADGVIEEQGTPDELFINPKSSKTAAFLGHVGGGLDL
ncbi:MAG: amino acid ABC transporter ATP-binding protein [Clostridia bacterium]|nr:amino acid ABC transporter ATP-binding protein [Clostridia bacterium]